MISDVYSIRDVKASVFSAPMLSASEGTMRRSVVDVLANKDHPYSRHPEDYVLYFLGRFDDNSGMFDLEDTPVSLVCLQDLVSV